MLGPILAPLSIQQDQVIKACLILSPSMLEIQGEYSLTANNVGISKHVGRVMKEQFIILIFGCPSQ